MVLAMAITIGIAELSWRWLEKPLIELAHRTSYRRSPARVGAAL
jgi:peptidoglycan/LPS O-acetylase OafA/YrhL